MRSPLTLPTDAGSIEIVEDHRGACDTCGRQNDVELRVDNGEDATWQRARLRLCGNCIARALSIHYGRSHVEAGGAVEDLRTPASKLEEGPNDGLERFTEGLGR